MRFVDFLKTEVFEMAKPHQFHQNKNLIGSFKQGTETFDITKDGKEISYKKDKSIPSNKLEKGQIVFASYNSTNAGGDMYEILGFTNDDKPYGKGGPVFHTLKDLFIAHGLQASSSLANLYKQQESNKDGYNTYLYVKDLTNNTEGPWFYLNSKGQWCRGSGAEVLSFCSVKEV